MEFEENTSKSADNELSLIDILYLLLRNWYWFLLSIIICVGIGIIHLKKQPRIYTRTATVLIKDNSNNSGLSEASAFEELNLYSMKRNVGNEIVMFKAHQLMSEVVRRLHLEVSYMIKDKFRMTELYTQSPVQVSFVDADDSEYCSFQIIPVSQKQVRLTGFSVVLEGEDAEKCSLVTNLNDTINTPVGRLVVSPTLYYTDEYRNIPIYVSKANLKDVAQSFRGALKVELTDRMTTIISLTLNDVSIPRAEDVINTLVAVYNEDAINDKNRIVINTSNFINERLQIIEKELQMVDTDIEVYKKANRLTDISSEAGMYLGNKQQYNNENLTLDNQLILADFVRDYLVNPQKSTELIPVNAGITDMNVASQINEYNSLLLKRDKLYRRSGGNNPIVMELNNTLAAMKQSIIRSLDNLIAGLKIKMNNIHEREIFALKRISDVPTQQKYVLSVERQQKIKEELYLYLLNKREENALTQAITESNARIIDPALGSNAPISPQSSVILLAAFVLGCFFPGAGLWLIAISDTKIHTRKEVEEKISMPFLGEVPLRDKKDKGKIVVKENSRDAVSEAFRIIRTNMDFMCMKDCKQQVVMFTSFNPGAGKTFIAMNLAMSIALTRKKVVLLDLDIRKGTLTHVHSHDHANQPGITHYLSGRVDDLDKIIRVGGLHEYLDVIGAGPIPPNPAELLLSERLDRLIVELRKRYDYIIIDNVPAGMVADAVIVNRVVDMTIYVIRAEKMDRRLLPELEKLYKEGKFRNMSLILNGIRYNRKGYGYVYGYGYGSFNKAKN